MQQNKHRIQIIGSFLDLVSKKLNARGIVTENLISGINPLSLVGEFNKEHQKYSDMPNLKPNELLNIRKNLDRMLSHDPKTFSDNINMHPIGKEVRVKNTSEYLVYMNSSVELTLLEKNDTVYSMFPDNEFTKDMQKSGNCIIRSFPFSGAFNWKYYYDKFINIILKEYDTEHIIFIRSNCSRFYMDGSDIKAFDNLPEKFVEMIEEMDQYFIEKTHCLVINEHYSNIPHRYVDCLFPYIPMMARSAEAIADEIYDIIVNKNKDVYMPYLPQYSNDFSKFLFLKLSSEIINKNKESLILIKENSLTIDKIIENYLDGNEFFNDIIKLGKFVDCNNRYGLSEYATDVCLKKEITAEFELIELYTRYFKLDLNDIIGAYLLCNECKNASEFQKIAANILNNGDCVPVGSARKFKKRNIAVLKEYSYLDGRFIQNADTADIYIRLENNCYIVLNTFSVEPIRKVRLKINSTVDYNSIIDNNYICPVSYADALTNSFDYYVEKARNGYGTKPTFLKFDSVEDFTDSLSYIDYSELLKNEKFVFDIAGAAADYSDYAPIADFTDFIDPDTVIVLVWSGLGDQIGYYVMGQLIKDITGRKVLYQDFCQAFNGMEVQKLAAREMDFVNSRLSPRLNALINDRFCFFKNVCLKINKEYCILITAETHDPKCSTTVFVRNYRQLVTLNIPHTFILANVHAELWKTLIDYDIHDYVKFPPLINEEHIRLEKEMLDCDAVVIHIRRGDYVKHFADRGLFFNYDRYIEAIQKLLAIPDYPNKKYFVFSDDTQWCMDNMSKVGLDLVGDSEIKFISGNKYDESFRDMQLMSNGKIMIGGNSGFFNFSVLYSERCELYLGAKDTMFSFMKNKYDVGTFKEKLAINKEELNAKLKAPKNTSDSQV